MKLIQLHNSYLFLFCAFIIVDFLAFLYYSIILAITIINFIYQHHGTTIFLVAVPKSNKQLHRLFWTRTHNSCTNDTPLPPPPRLNLSQLKIFQSVHKSLTEHWCVNVSASVLFLLFLLLFFFLLIFSFFLLFFSWRSAALETYMRRVYRAHEILDISVGVDGDEATVDWSFRFRDTSPKDSPVKKYFFRTFFFFSFSNIVLSFPSRFVFCFSLFSLLFFFYLFFFACVLNEPY